MDHQFVLITTPEFIELPDTPAWLQTVDPLRVETLIREEDWPALSQILEDTGIIAPNALISDARLIDAGDGPRFWYRPA